MRILTAEKIYSLLKRADYPDWALKQWEAAFKSDDHTLWYIWVAEIMIHSVSGTATGGTGNAPSDQDSAFDDVDDNAFPQATEKDKEFWEQVSNQILPQLISKQA